MFLGESPALDASKTSGDGVYVTAMGVLPFLKASMKNQPSSYHQFLEESLTVPVALHFHSLLVCPAAVDLARFVVVDIVPPLLIPRRMLGRWLVRWRMLCHHLVCWRMLCCRCRWPPLWEMLCFRE